MRHCRRYQGQVVQRIVSLTKSLVDNFVKHCSIHKIKCAYILADKMEEAFAMQKLLTFFSAKNCSVFGYNTIENLKSLNLTTSLVLNNLALVRDHGDFVVVVVMLFYVHSKRLKSCRNGQTV